MHLLNVNILSIRKDHGKSITLSTMALLGTDERILRSTYGIDGICR